MASLTRDLGFPPEFRPDGGDPPLTSPPIVVLDRLAPVKMERRPKLRDLLRTVEAVSIFGGVRLNVSQALDESRSWTELRRFRSSTFWEREPQTIQLAPGVTTERSIRLTVGLSREHTETFARAFEIKTGADLKVIQGKISERWSESVGEKLTFEATQEHTETLRLENPSSDPNVYRRFAIWTVMHEYAVDRLNGIELTRDFEPEELEQLRGIPAIWAPVAPPIRITASRTVVTSSIDVGRPTAASNVP
jgi:hypothetical protein